jgi:hypothetical protein
MTWTLTPWRMAMGRWGMAKEWKHLVTCQIENTWYLSTWYWSDAPDQFEDHNDNQLWHLQINNYDTGVMHQINNDNWVMDHADQTPACDVCAWWTTINNTWVMHQINYDTDQLIEWCTRSISLAWWTRLIMTLKSEGPDWSIMTLMSDCYDIDTWVMHQIN